MIQRIQSLYLIIADLFIAVLFFVPLAQMTDKGGVLFHMNLTEIVRDGVEGGVIQSNWQLLLLVSIILILNILTILQFKNRPRQIRQSYAAILLLLGLMGLIYMIVWRATTVLDGSFSMKPYVALPLVAAAFIYFAIRGITKDENLVRSIDRIR